MPHLLRVYITRPRGEPSESKGWLGAATRRLCRARQPCWGWLEHRRPAGRALVGAGASACALSSFRCMYQIVRGYPRSYLGCTVELDSHLGCSGAPKLVYIHVVQASGCVVIVRKSPHHPLPPLPARRCFHIRRPKWSETGQSGRSPLIPAERVRFPLQASVRVSPARLPLNPRRLGRQTPKSTRPPTLAGGGLTPREPL